MFGLESINSFLCQDYADISVPFVILANDQYSSFPFIPTLGNYSLHAIITFEEIEVFEDVDPTNHFMCLGFSNDGYFIYDNLLRLSPGTYQGECKSSFVFQLFTPF